MFISTIKNKTNFLTMGLIEKLGLLPEAKLVEEMQVKLRAEVLRLYKEAEKKPDSELNGSIVDSIVKNNR